MSKPLPKVIVLVDKTGRGYQLVRDALKVFAYRLMNDPDEEIDCEGAEMLWLADSARLLDLGAMERKRTVEEFANGAGVWEDSGYNAALREIAGENLT